MESEANIEWVCFSYETFGTFDHESTENCVWKEQEILVYRVWLSEILLQQTQASRVVGSFDRMIERFPTIKDLAETDYEIFFPYYQWLGYYSRARNILKTAKIVHEQYSGIFPNDKNILMKLPGVWPYTAEAIQAFGYGIPTLSWDTNLEKVFARYYNGTKDTRLAKEEKQIIQKDLLSFLCWKCENGGSRGRHCLSDNENNNSVEQSEEEWVWLPLETFGTFGHKSTEICVWGSLIRSINNALMDFAALVDLKNPANIDWSNYPIRSGRFYETRGGLEKVETKKQIAFPIPDATIIVILHKDHKVYYSSGIRHPELVKDPEFQKHGFFVPQNDGNREIWNWYEPFILSPSLTRNTREYVQWYFREKYALELSVRPVHKKWLSEDGKPYIAVNAQVQVGEIQFEKWNKKGEKI